MPPPLQTEAGFAGKIPAGEKNTRRAENRKRRAFKSIRAGPGVERRARVSCFFLSLPPTHYPHVISGGLTSYARPEDVVIGERPFYKSMQNRVPVSRYNQAKEILNEAVCDTRAEFLYIDYTC